MQTKTDKVRELVALHRWKDALRIAQTFRLGLTIEQQRVLGRAWASYNHGYLMEQMKRDPQACRREGIALLQELYGKGSEINVRRTA